MKLNLPKRRLDYKGGYMLLNRNDDPKYQCQKCYKPFFADEVVEPSVLGMALPCPNCQSGLRTITDSEPLITD